MFVTLELGIICVGYRKTRMILQTLDLLRSVFNFADM